MIIDLIFLAFMLLSLIIGAKRGLIGSLQGIITWAATIILITAFLNPAIGFISSTQAAANIQERVFEWIAQNADVGNYLSTVVTLPEGILSDAPEAIAQAVAPGITMLIIKLAALLALLILIRLIMRIIFSVLKLASKLPVINGANRFLGAVLSAVSTLLLIYLVCAVLSILANPSIYMYINNTYIVRYLFDNNILLQLFMRI